MKHSYSNYSAPLPGYGTSLVDRINLYLHFRKYFKMIEDRWLLLVISIILGTSGGAWIAWTQPDFFEAKALMTAPLKQNNPRFSGVFEEASDAVNRRDMERSDIRDRALKNIQEGSASSNKFSYSTWRVAVDNSGMYNLTVTSTNQEFAVRFVRTWAEEFVQWKKSQKQTSLANGEAAIIRDLAKLEQEQESRRQSFKDFKSRNSIVDIRDAGLRANQQRELRQNELSAIKTEIEIFIAATPDELATGGVSVRDNLADSKQNRPSRASRDEDASDRFGPGSHYSQLRLDLRQLQIDYTNRLQTLKKNHPYMRQLTRKIIECDSAIVGSLSLINEAKDARIKSLQVKASALPKVIDMLTEEISNQGAIQIEYAQFESEIQIHADQITNIKVQQAGMRKSSSDSDTFEIIDRGSGSERPVGPNRPKLIWQGFGIGLLAGIGVLWLFAKLDDRLESPELIEAALEEPIMGQLPEVNKSHYKDGYLVLSRMKSHNMFAESLRGVRSTLLLSPEGSSKRFIAVTSAVPGDGKTTFTTNFAITLANSGNRTLLIDADMRRGNIHGYFEQPIEGGLAEVLGGKLTVNEAIHSTAIPNLFFMRSGERPSNPSELLIGSNTRELIRQLRSEFDYVIVDCPPLTAIDDTFSIAAYLDGIFFVIRSGKTSIRFAKMAIQTIRQRGSPILGLIVNGVPIDNPYYYYTTYYYASYYHRSVKESEQISRPASKLKKIPALPPGMQTVNQETPPASVKDSFSSSETL